jgi:hypothetical protein
MKRFGILISGLLVLILLASGVSAVDLTVTKTVDPGTIYVYDPARPCSPQSTTVTLSVTGYGGTVTTTRPMDVVFAIDSSASMQVNDPANLRLSGAQGFVGQLDNTRDQVGVIGWDQIISVNQPLTQNFVDADNAIALIPSSGVATNGELGLQTAIDTLDANTMIGSRDEVIIFLTDGDFNDGDVTVAAQITAAQLAGYRVYTVGLTTNPLILQTIATDTGGKNYLATSAADIEAIYQDILTTIVTQTSPSDVDVVEVTMPYIVNEGTFSTPPDSVVEVGGETTITWLNVGQYVGNLDNRLDSTETFTVTFEAGSSAYGLALDVDDVALAAVNSIDPDGNSQTQAIPQALLDILFCNEPPDTTGAFPGGGDCLWPPNHKFVTGEILGVTDSNGDPFTITITGITSDEPTATDPGSGGAKHAPDASGVGTSAYEVRVERSGDLNGRVYAVSFTADDGLPNGASTGTVYVQIPHDQSPPPCDAVDDGQNYDATAIN